MRNIQLFIKVCFDCIVCIVMGIILLPFMIVISIAICLDSKGNPFFLQERIGKKGKVFKIIKFRTMVCNSENKGDGLFIKEESDSRITKVGKFLRRTSLDEIPQIFNILKGDMSIVGPRPPVTYHPYEGYEGYSDFAKQRFDMRPGITGLAQIKKRNSATWDERIVIDVEYVQNFSLWLDMKIMIGTAASMKYEEKYVEK